MNDNTLYLIVGISQIILFVTLTIMAIYIIVSLKKFLFSISNIEKEVAGISNEITPVIKDMKFIADDIKMIVDKSKYQFEKIEEVSDKLIDKGTALVGTISNIQDAGNGFLLNITNLVSAITKGVKTFGNKISNGSVLTLKNFN